MDNWEVIYYITTRQLVDSFFFPSFFNFNLIFFSFLM